MLVVCGCQGENGVVGESLSAQLPGGAAPTDSGTTNQWVDGLNGPDHPELCMPAVLPVSDGVTHCVVAEALDRDAEDTDCSCTGPGRRPLNPVVSELVVGQLMHQASCADAESCAKYCMCEVTAATGDGRTVCEQEEQADDANGWCYVSPDQGLGNPELVETCPPTEQRKLRFVGAGAPSSADALYVLACQGTERQAEPAKLGEACIVTDEYKPTWSGFAVTGVSVETQAGACESDVCLIHHFQGRASCPYGQTQVEAEESPKCFVPGTVEPVTVPVVPQLLERREATASICSCRCDGPGEGPFCECPESMECKPLFSDLGLEGEAEVAGSYCIPSGTEYSELDRGGAICDREQTNCEEAQP